MISAPHQRGTEEIQRDLQASIESPAESCDLLHRLCSHPPQDT
jgi:hypothetical protein